MKSLKRNARDGRHRASGFSLLEMVITISILIIASCVAVVSLIPMLNSQHLTNAYNTTLGTLRQARDCAVSQRTSYQVTFTQPVGSPGQIAVTATLAFPGDPCSATYSCRRMFCFRLTPRFPRPRLPTPARERTLVQGRTRLILAIRGAVARADNRRFIFARTVRRRRLRLVRDRATGTMAWCTWRAPEIC